MIYYDVLHYGMTSYGFFQLSAGLALDLALSGSSRQRRVLCMLLMYVHVYVNMCKYIECEYNIHIDIQIRQYIIHI